MRWTAVAEFVALAWRMVRKARAAAALTLVLFLPVQSFAVEIWKAHPDSLEISYSLRIGSCSGPAAYSYVDESVTNRRLGLFDVQIALRQGNFGQVATGMDLLFGPRFMTVGDSSFYEFEHVRYSAIFMYVSPGFHVRVGKDQPLSLGASIDVGPLWARESYLYSWWRSNEGDLAVERILAIRPRLQMSYNLTHSLHVQIEYGWMHGKIRPAYRYDHASNWYVEIPRDFDGPYFISSIAITRPVARKAIMVGVNKSRR